MSKKKGKHKARNLDNGKIAIKVTPGGQEVPTPQETMDAVVDAVAEAGGIPQGMTSRQAEKMRQQAKQYWKGMVSRAEAKEMVQSSVTPLIDQNRMLYIQVKTLTELLKDRLGVTEEELNELSKPVIVSIFGSAPVAEEETPEQPTEEAPATEESTDDTTL